MIADSVMCQIENGTITTRKQLYQVMGRSRALLSFLNQHNILVPERFTKEELDSMLVELHNKGELGPASAHVRLRQLLRKYYGTWNNALKANNIPVTQERYNLSREEALTIIHKFHTENRRPPCRDEFNGKKYPYWGAIKKALGIESWYAVLSEAGYDAKHGTGYASYIDGELYLSSKEYIIASIIKQGFNFQKEVPYGNCNYVFDFYIPTIDTYIEYYGLETPEYLARIDEKRKYYGGRRVVEFFKKDKLAEKFMDFITLEYDLLIRRYDDDRDAYRC